MNVREYLHNDGSPSLYPTLSISLDGVCISKS